VEYVYLTIVIVLFLLAASDLIVGVSNDAVNFLNAAIGSRVAPFRTIVIVAALGIMVGAVFSSGMMEVARKGIFNPGEFYFSEIMIIFMAVMVTDVILLDAYNTAGLPTSTTVSIVFELLGAAVGMATIKLISSDGGMTIGQFINSSKALAIISGILLSVGIAFTTGALIQYFIRIAFSFNYVRRIKYLGAVWGGIAFTAMTYFMLIKGAKGASFMTDETKDWINANSALILLYSWIGWTILLQLLFWLTRFNILKVIVLIGTFALAMAFAGNDLVNFIGVPIAGFNSYELFAVNPGADPNSFLMSGLAGKVPTPTLFLVIAGIIMVLTLFISSKARSVVQTSLDLGRQDEGDERFRSTWISKVLVRSSINFSSNIKKALPGGLVRTIEKQFEPYKEKSGTRKKDKPEFDLIRASVILTVSSILIAFGTSLKLPLSTTYVTFMVAMGASLADKAWDRESAVYRISGVFAVVGGWFLTAISAFTVAFIMVYIFNYAGIVGMVIMLAVVAYVIYRTHVIHHKKTLEEKGEEDELETLSDENIVEKSMKGIVKNLKIIVENYGRAIDGLEKENFKDLKKKEIDKITARTKYLKDHIGLIVEKLRAEATDTAYYFVQVLDYMREMLHSISFIVTPALNHVDNNHKPLLKEQINELRKVHARLSELILLVAESLKAEDFSKQEELQELQRQFLGMLGELNKVMIKRIKNAEVGTKNSILYFNILNETKNLALQVVNLYKSQRDFVNYQNNGIT